jgi:hypothetical protein
MVQRYAKNDNVMHSRNPQQQQGSDDGKMEGVEQAEESEGFLSSSDDEDDA